MWWLSRTLYTLHAFMFLVTSHAQRSMANCILPKRPVGGRYELVACSGNSCDATSGSRVPIGSLLSYTCDEGYILQGNTISSCYMNEWYMSPTCVRSCPGLKSESVDIKCTYRGEIVSCKSGILPGTKAILSCKLAYIIPLADDPGYRELICLDDGSWNRNVFQCIPECGIEVPHGQSLIVNGFPAKYPAYPWHVGIYIKTNTTEDFQQICGGTLISPDLVISAAHCFWDDTIRGATSATKYAVAAGKYYRSYNIPLVDAFAQKSEVKRVDIAERFFGITGNWAHDIALLRVKTPFMLNTLVRPICVDWDNRHQAEHLREGRSGKAVGWGKTENGLPSSGLREINLPFIPHQNCVTAVPEDFKGFVTPDKFCAGYLNGTSLCEGDSGGGIFFQFDGLWFLRGVVSVAPVTRERDMCDNNYYTAFTNVGLFLEWIRAIYFSSSYRGPIAPENDFAAAAPTDVLPSPMSTSGCILPGQPADGTFELDSCERPCDVLPGTRVPNGSSLTYKCNEDYSIEGNNIVSCNSGVWTSTPTCLKNDPGITNCPALRSESVEIICKRRDKIVSCEHAIAPLTVATLTCKDYYRVPADFLPGYNEITCLEDGTWDRTLFKCIPECGIAVPEGTQITANGDPIMYNKFPWQVFIYVTRSFASPIYQCMGTLISPNLVISRITCFLDEYTGMDSNWTYVAAVGKYDPTYNRVEPYAQKSIIERVTTIEKSRDFFETGRPNIALIHLKTSFTMTTLVRPICLDWRNIHARNEGIKGLSGARSYENPPYISDTECRWKAQVEYRKYIKSDTFCVNSDQIESLENLGDCGIQDHGGFACQFGGEWNLVGIYSWSIASQDNSYPPLDLFTKVDLYVDAIEAIYIRTTQ